MLNQNNTFIHGCWRLDSWNLSNAGLISFIEQLIELGIDTFDHADIYGNYSCEAIFGAVLRHAPELRQRLKITTKCGIKLPSDKFPDHTHIYDTSYQHIIAAVNRSLTNLATDYIDTLLIHRPDMLLEGEEVARAFQQLLQEGKVLAFGVSNFLPHQFELLQSYLDFPLTTNQVEASVLSHDNFTNGTLDYLRKLRIRPQIWSPLAGGRIFNDDTPNVLRVREALAQIALKHDAKLEQIALAWLLRHPSKMQIILGSGKIERIREMLASANIQLSRDEWFKIWTAYTGHDIP